MKTILGESDLRLTCFLEAGGIAILRCETASEIVVLPDTINDLPITRIGDYAFSSREPRSIPNDTFVVTVTTGTSMPIVHNAAAIRQVHLPHNLVHLGSYCFYNCTQLALLEVGPFLKNIGSDAFMNCFALHRIDIRTSALKCHCLCTILQIYHGELEVRFFDSSEPEYRLFFPAYDEEYEEMAAPHIFYYNIAGNGYLCRQSFSDGIFNFSQYDAAFDLLIRTHSFHLATRVALNRLQFPTQLSESAHTIYLQHITAHNHDALQSILEQNDTVRLHFFLNLQIATLDSLRNGCDTARRLGQTEALSLLLEYQNRFFGARKARSFDL